MERDLFGVRIDDLSAEALDRRFEQWLEGEDSHIVATPNAEFLLQALREPSFVQVLNRSDVSVADSVSVSFAAAALWNERLAHRIPGADLLDRLCALAARRGDRVLLLGGAPGAADAAERTLARRHSQLNIVAFDPGRLDLTGERLDIDDGLVARLHLLAPRIVAVALGQGKQERFIAQMREHCPSVRIWIGVGGALDMLSGQRPRAPSIMRRMGLEWLWRLAIEPRRWRRILRASIIFPFIVAREAARRGTLVRSTGRVVRAVLKNVMSITTTSPLLPTVAKALAGRKKQGDRHRNL